MANYKIEISKTAERQFTKLGEKDQLRIARVINQLAVDPHPQGCRKLTGYKDVFRIRVGNYRIIYSVEKKRLIIIILKIGHRKDIYRQVH